MYDKSFMLQAVDIAYTNSNLSKGGPFGASVVKDGKLISCESNTVLSTNDPTAHAEINAIRKACQKLQTHDLSDCELYATGYPCPMCLGAIMWANIRKVYISGTLEDAENIGFKDKHIYETIDNLSKMCYNTNELEFEFKDRNLAQELYKNYSISNGIIY